MYVDDSDIDEKIHAHNANLYKSWNHKEKITFELKSDITGKIIQVVLEGDFITCKDCRDKILEGSFNWTQGSLRREKM
jgi:hypothetical protein